ncbi:MAG: heme exporter protein CcmB [Eggerthellaceae bacterium]|jgi:heme exporter protein B
MAQQNRQRLALKHPSTFAQYRTLLSKDLRQEFRTKEMVTSMGIFAVLVIIVYGAALALTAQSIDIASMSGGLIWALIVFTSLTGLNRSFSHEKEQGCLEGILLVPLDRSVIYLAKATSNFIFLALVEVIAVPLFMFFFMTTVPFAPTFGMIVWPLLLGTIGMAGVGTMLATITANTRSRDVLLAVLFIPLIYPLLYACVTATTAAILGSAQWMDLYTMPLVMAAGYDVIMLLACWVLYGFAVSA